MPISKNMNLVKTISVAVGLALVSACSSIPPRAENASSASAQTSVCVEIATTCHEHEGYSAKAKDCHEMGHSRESTEQQCQSQRAECLEECKAGAQAHGRASGNTEADNENEHAPGSDPQHVH